MRNFLQICKNGIDRNRKLCYTKITNRKGDACDDYGTLYKCNVADVLPQAALFSCEVSIKIPDRSGTRSSAVSGRSACLFLFRSAIGIFDLGGQ